MTVNLSFVVILKQLHFPSRQHCTFLSLPLFSRHCSILYAYCFHGVDGHCFLLQGSRLMGVPKNMSMSVPFVMVEESTKKRA